MKSFLKLMLSAAVVAGGLGMGAAPAQAARIGVYVRGPVAYVPQCPGPGYVWVDGYYANGYWVPGFWQAPEVGFGIRIGGPVVRFGHGPVFHDRALPRRDRDHDHDRFRR